MRKNHKTNKQNMMMRLLTLVCFFHFSGLNNGAAYLIVSSEKVENVSFAPFVIKEAGLALNPANWKKFAHDKLWGTLFKSGKIVRSASCNAIQNILVEAAFFQIWMNQSFKTVAVASSEKRFPAEKVLTSPSSAETKETSSLNRSMQSGEFYGMDHTNKYLANGRENVWIKAEQFSFYGKSQRFCSVPKFLIQGQWKNIGKTSSVSAKNSVTMKILEFFPDRVCRRITYSSENGSDEPASSLLIVFQHPKSFKNHPVSLGDFLFFERVV